MSQEQYITISNLPIRDLSAFAKSHKNNQLLRSYLAHCAPFLRRNILRAAYQLNH
jgi:hypothetical protein